MEKEWVIIFESMDTLQVEMARQALERVEIDSVIFNKKDRTYGFGGLELYIHRDHAIRAKQILKDFQS
jgi:hypothetical protein